MSGHAPKVSKASFVSRPRFRLVVSLFVFLLVLPLVPQIPLILGHNGLIGGFSLTLLASPVAIYHPSFSA